MKISETPCPVCGEKRLKIEIRMHVIDGLLSGSSPKFTARDQPVLLCDGCFAWVEGTVEPDGEHALFDHTKMRSPAE